MAVTTLLNKGDDSFFRGSCMLISKRNWNLRVQVTYNVKFNHERAYMYLLHGGFRFYWKDAKPKLKYGKMELFKLRNEFNIYLVFFLRYKMIWGCLRFINRDKSFERKSLRLNAILIAFKWKAIIFSAELASMSFLYCS